jgi:hypothetical protein
MKLKIATLGAALLFVSQGAVAMPVYDGTYGLGNAGNDTRGIWTNVGRFSVVSGSFSVTGNTAAMVGDVFSSTYGGLTFDVGMTYRCSSSVSNAGGNSVSIDNNACGLINQPTGGAVSGSDVDGQIWDFWDWSPSELIGYGALDGLTIDISQKPTDLSKPFRVGVGADWDDVDLLGGSGWLNLGSFNCAVGAACERSNFNPRSADFNFRFADVPEPATLALIGLGLFGIGAARRRK